MRSNHQHTQVRDQPAIPTTAIPTLLPPVTLGFRQFWSGQGCVGMAGAGIAVCTQSKQILYNTQRESLVTTHNN